MYYALYDRQTGCYMATGKNTTSKRELVNEYWAYKSIDTPMPANISLQDSIAYIESDGFAVDEDDAQFTEY